MSVNYSVVAASERVYLGDEARVRETAARKSRVNAAAAVRATAYCASDAIFVFRIYRRRALEFADAPQPPIIARAAFIARLLRHRNGPLCVGSAVNENYSASRPPKLAARGECASKIILPHERANRPAPSRRGRGKRRLFGATRRWTASLFLYHSRRAVTAEREVEGEIRFDVRKHLDRARRGRSSPLLAGASRFRRSDVLTLQTATPTRLVADGSGTKKTQSESSRASRPFRCAAPSRETTGVSLAIRYVAGDQPSPRFVLSFHRLASPRVSRSLARVLLHRGSQALILHSRSLSHRLSRRLASYLGAL